MMNNRDKFITIAFLVFILTIPVVTIVRNCIPSTQEQQLTDEEKAILQQNGTMQTVTENTETSETEASETGTTEAGETLTEVNEPLFIQLQAKINTFIEGLFGRTKLIAFNTNLTSLLTGGTYIESTQTLQGKNNMFFYKTELDGHPLWDYMGINRFTDEELSAIADNLTATKEYLNGRGIEFYTMLMPNKEIIYEENMPDTIARVNKESRGEQLSDYITENTDVVCVYPKEELIEAKNSSDTKIWYDTDSHCNQRGSFIAIQALFERIYGTSASIDSVSFRVDATDYSGDLVNMAGISDKYKIDTVYVFEKESADKSQYHDQTLLFVGDSFGGFLSTVAGGYYKDVIWVYPSQFEFSMYEEYEPDVVIWESVERYCETFMNPTFLEN
jgi:hypothetical protein